MVGSGRFARLAMLWLLVFTAVPAASVVGREWSDATGRFRVEGELLGVADGKAKLKLKDGREISVPVNRLSKADQDYIKRQASKVSTEDAEKAARLVDQAFALLKLDPRNNATVIDAKLREAGRLNPENINAEFLRGIYHLLVSSDPDRASESFEQCLKTEPDNPAVLSNAGLARLKAGSFFPALQHFQKAVKIDPTLPSLSQNLGRALMVHNDGRLEMPQRIADQYADLYGQVAASDDAPPAHPELGWLLVNINPRETKPEDNPDLPDDVTSGGTGFVVKGEYIVTNRHVVEDATRVKIRVPGQDDLRLAQIVSISDDADVAVLRCPGLSLPPIGVVADVPRRGSDVMVLGFPQFWQLGATIKSTRGAVTSLPAKETDQMLLIDAEMNSGNSGGPIANKRGQVVAIATAVFKPRGGTGGRYGAGIPISTQLDYLKKHIPGLEAAVSSDEKSWPDVDEKVSASTVLVLVAGTEPNRPDSGYAGLIYDPSCPACAGSKEITEHRVKKKCPHCRGLGLDRIAALEILRRKANEADPVRPTVPSDPGSPSTPSLPGGDVQLAKVIYGIDNRTIDVTQKVEAALAKDPFAPVMSDYRKMGDPAEGIDKTLTLTYTSGGKSSNIVLHKNEHAFFPPWPRHGKAVADADSGFKIVAARHGGGMEWVDVTHQVAGRVAYPDEPFHWHGFHIHDAFPHRTKYIAIWFDYQGKRYARIKASGEFGALLDSSKVLVPTKKPVFAGRVEVTQWNNKMRDKVVGRTATQFCMLSSVQGHFGDHNEKVQIGVDDRNNWTFGGGSRFELFANATTITSSLRKEFEPELTHYEWKTRQKRVKMIHSSEGFCFLSGLGGRFAGGGELVKVHIDPKDGFWYLEGAAQTGLSGSATAVKLKKDSKLKLQYSQVMWAPWFGGETKMLPADQGFAFISGAQGNFAGTGERITVRQDEGYWKFGGGSQQFLIGFAYTARVVKAD